MGPKFVIGDYVSWDAKSSNFPFYEIERIDELRTENKVKYLYGIRPWSKNPRLLRFNITRSEGVLKSINKPFEGDIDE